MIIVTQCNACLPIIGQAKATPIRHIGLFEVIHQETGSGAKSDIYDGLVYSDDVLSDAHHYRRRRVRLIRAVKYKVY